MRSAGYLIIALGLIISLALAQDGVYGKPGEYLRFGTCARGLALGGAYSTIVNNADALLYNPAGLGALERWELAVTHAQLFLDSRYENVSFGYPIGKIGNIGLSLTSFGISKFEGRDQFSRPTGEFSLNDIAISAGFGRWFWGRRFRMGISGKYLSSSMGDYSASGFGGVDFGVVTKDIMRKFRVGLAVYNLGASEIAGDKLPMVIRFGVGIKPIRRIFLLADVEKVEDVIRPHFGAEAKITKFLLLRAGYNMNEVTFGLGLALDRMISSMRGLGRPSLDYAGAVMNPVGNDYMRFTLTFHGAERYKLSDLMAQTDPCARLTEFEGLLDKDGLIGAKANLIFGDCYFTYESKKAPLSAAPNFKDVYPFFKEAYIGKFGANWVQNILATEGSNLVFSQRTHYMFAEVSMHKQINEETKNLIQDLISLGGDSAQYDVRLQYDLAYTYEVLGYLDSAKALYTEIANMTELEDPVRPLAMYRLAYLTRESDPTGAIGLLKKLVQKFGFGFYDENWGRLSYPMFPKKYKDNSIADDALLLMGDIYAAQGGEDNAKNALIAYLDIILFYPDADREVVTAAAQRAANIYDKLGMTKEAENMRKLAGSL